MPVDDNIGEHLGTLDSFEVGFGGTEPCLGFEQTADLNCIL